jgi:hypothetical protein
MVGLSLPASSRNRGPSFVPVDGEANFIRLGPRSNNLVIDI